MKSRSNINFVKPRTAVEIALLEFALTSLARVQIRKIPGYYHTCKTVRRGIDYLNG